MNPGFFDVWGAIVFTVGAIVMLCWGDRIVGAFKGKKPAGPWEKFRSKGHVPDPPVSSDMSPLIQRKRYGNGALTHRLPSRSE